MSKLRDILPKDMDCCDEHETVFLKGDECSWCERDAAPMSDDIVKRLRHCQQETRSSDEYLSELAYHSANKIDRLTKERDQLREQNDLLRSLSKRLTQRIYTLMKDSGELAELVGEKP